MTENMLKDFKQPLQFLKEQFSSVVIEVVCNCVQNPPH